MIPLIQLSHVSRRFQVGPERIDALRGVSLAIQPGATVAVTGPSGSGKSTLLNILGLLDHPTEGEFRFAGRDLGAASDDERTALRRQQIGIVFQSAPMLPRLSAAENVAVPLLYRGLKPRAALQQALTALDRVGLADYARRRPHQLSGGLVQRVAIARALVGRPQVLLADEPLAALDPEAAERMLALFLQLNRDETLTVIVVTHDAAVARRCAHRLTLRSGALQAPEIVN